MWKTRKPRSIPKLWQRSISTSTRPRTVRGTPTTESSRSLLIGSSYPLAMPSSPGQSSLRASTGCRGSREAGIASIVDSSDFGHRTTLLRQLRRKPRRRLSAEPPSVFRELSPASARKIATETSWKAPSCASSHSPRHTRNSNAESPRRPQRTQRSSAAAESAGTASSPSTSGLLSASGPTSGTPSYHDELDALGPEGWDEEYLYREVKGAANDAVDRFLSEHRRS